MPNTNTNSFSSLLELLSASNNPTVTDVTAFATQSESREPTAASSNTASEMAAVFKNVNDQTAQINQQLVQVIATSQSHVDTLSANTQALLQNTASRGSGSSFASTVGSLAETFLGGGSLLSPIISGIIDLFGGGSQATAPVLTPYIPPNPIEVETTIGAVSRPTGPPPGSSAQTTTTAQIQVNINALDSKSFLDHSDDIAKAVRQAILYSSSLNDVISDM